MIRNEDFPIENDGGDDGIRQEIWEISDEFDAEFSEVLDDEYEGPDWELPCI